MPDGLRPTNLHLRDSVQTRHITSDLYDISGRIAELDPSLFIVEMREDDKFAWSIMEDCADGVARLVFRTNDLDARVLTQLRKIMSVPLQTRLEIAERERAKFEAEEADRQFEELYENVGGPMRHELARNGFLGAPLPMNVRPMNRAARRAGRRMR